jgi:choline dehydrogenase
VILAGGPFPDGDGWQFFVGAALLKPRSRGTVTDHVDFRYFEEPDDMVRLLEGLERALLLAEHPAIRDLTRGATPTVPNGADRAARVLDAAWTYHHPVGTCAIGTVVDARCEVQGVTGLSVVDASVMPDTPSANTHLPVTMLAEHAAANFLRA